MNEKTSPRRGRGRSAQRRRACLPGLGKKQLLHWDPDTSKVLDLLPESARIENGELTLGGLPASELANRHGTPLLVYCEQTIRDQVRAYREAAPGAVLVYGTKAFANVALLRLLAEEGAGADVSTLGELAFAQTAGVPGERIVFLDYTAETYNRSQEWMRERGLFDDSAGTPDFAAAVQV